MALYAITLFSYLSSSILHLYIDLWKGDFFDLVLPEYNAKQPHISANLNFVMSHFFTNICNRTVQSFLY